MLVQDSKVKSCLQCIKENRCNLKKDLYMKADRMFIDGDLTQIIILDCKDYKSKEHDNIKIHKRSSYKYKNR